MKAIPQYCQKCRQKNILGESNCSRCGARLMLVVFPQSLKYDTNYVPTYYEDHLLERVTSLELRLSQVTERLAATLDLMLRQSKGAHSDHILLETLIESLNTLGAVEKDKLTKNWRERLLEEESKDNEKKHREKLIAKVLNGQTDSSSADLFEHLVNEGIKLLSENEEKQGIRTLERALSLSPDNIELLLFIAQNFFLAHKFDPAKDYLEKTLKLQPNNPKTLLLLSVIYSEEGNILQAKPLISELSEKKDSTFCVNYIRGIIAAVEENWTETLSAFKELLAVRDSAETHYLIACVYFQLKRYKMAIRHLQKAVEQDENFADAWFMLSVIYANLNETEKSNESSEQAWNSKEPGAQCMEFINRKKRETLQTALPFLRLKTLKNRFLTSGSPRLTRIFNEELFNSLD